MTPTHLMNLLPHCSNPVEISRVQRPSLALDEFQVAVEVIYQVVRGSNTWWIGSNEGFSLRSKGLKILK